MHSFQVVSHAHPGSLQGYLRQPPEQEPPKSDYTFHEEQPGRILLAAPAPLIDLRFPQVHFLHRTENDQAKVVCGNPIPQIRG